MSNEKLFGEFTPQGKLAWVQKATEDLKGADFDKKLVWKTDEGFEIQPFYTQEDLPAASAVSSLHNTFGESGSWANLTEISVEDEASANKEALAALAGGGADGVLFSLGGKEKVNFDALLKGIMPEICTVSFRRTARVDLFTDAYFAYLKKTGVELSKIKGYNQFDALGRWTISGTPVDYKALASAIRTADAAPGFYPMTLCTGPFTDAGANYTQQTAYTLAKLTDYVEKLSTENIFAKQAMGSFLPVVVLATDYFFEIARLRAMRAILIEFNALYKTGIAPQDVKIGAATSSWDTSVYDPHTNMLRTTTEAMSAVLGGADFISIAAYDASFENSTPFSRRIALNICTILREESYFDKVADVAAGSYYIENLTAKLIESSLALFKKTEEEGGFVALFEKGEIQKQIVPMRSSKLKAIAQRRRNYVGVNRYPNLKETLTGDVLAGGAVSYSFGKNESGVEVLPQMRAPKAFEDMRAATDRFVQGGGKRPSVYPALYGNPAMRTARAQFTSDFFGVGGFQILPEVISKDVVSAAQAAAKSDAEIVAICSSDDDYLESALDFVKAFKAAAPGKQLVLAGYPQEITAQLDAAGLNGYVHMKAPVLETIIAFQKKFGVTA